MEEELKMENKKTLRLNLNFRVNRESVQGDKA
jgi:hypothetical protein